MCKGGPILSLLSKCKDFVSLDNIVALIGVEGKTMVFTRDGDVCYVDKSVRTVARKFEKLCAFYQSALTSERKELGRKKRKWCVDEGDIC
jgi:hypothetical protein